MFLSLSAAREELQCYYIFFRVPCCPLQMNRDEPSVTADLDVMRSTVSSAMLSVREETITLGKNQKKKS